MDDAPARSPPRSAAIRRRSASGSCASTPRDSMGWVTGLVPGRKRRLTEAERRTVIGLVATPPPGRLVRGGDGTWTVQDEAGAAQWTLDALTAAARERGIIVGRSQVRRSFVTEGVRWRAPRSWTTSTDPDVAPQDRRS